MIRAEKKRLAGQSILRVEPSTSRKAKYRNLVERLPCVVYLAEYGTNGEWLYVSPQIEHVLGYTQKEWLEHPHPQASFTHPDDLHRVQDLTLEYWTVATRPNWIRITPREVTGRRIHRSS